jgi:serine/threonine protein kinase
MGEVWRARDRLLRRPVAIKLIRRKYADDPQASARFRVEARCAARLCHPGIARVYDFSDSGQPFLVMELVEGPSLAEVLACGPIAPYRALEITGQVAGALSAVHRAGIVHQDIKPANILIGRRGKVKLTDFGVAALAGSAVGDAGTVSGTAAYVAPERMLGGRGGPAADLYSLGVVLYECLSGRRPFDGSMMQVATAHQLADVPPLPASVPPAARRFVLQLMAKDPLSRPADAAAVARTANELRHQLDRRPRLVGHHGRAFGRQLAPPLPSTQADLGSLNTVWA